VESRASIRKDERIDVRLHREAKALIAQAAAAENQSITDFMVSSTLDRSRQVLERLSTIRLNEKEAERFLAALVEPPVLSAKLREAVEQYNKAIAEGQLETV